MRFQITTIAALVALSSALPTLKVRQSGPVLADTTYDAISISGGQAGNAEAEALAIFSALDTANPANIDPADLDFLGAVNDVANDAEKEAFNPAIEAATGAEADALAAGKTKNKVLKLMATKLQLEAQQAQGKDVAAKLEEETTKLNNNIATDEANAGNPSTALPFDAAVSGGGNVAAGGNDNAAAGGNDNAAAGGNDNAAAAGGNNNAAAGGNNAAAGGKKNAAAGGKNAAAGGKKNAAAGGKNAAAGGNNAAAGGKDAAAGGNNAAAGGNNDAAAGGNNAAAGGNNAAAGGNKNAAAGGNNQNNAQDAADNADNANDNAANNNQNQNQNNGNDNAGGNAGGATDNFLFGGN